MSNPLIAPTQDSTKAYSGISLLESANDLSTAIESGDWASVAMGAVGTALDALSMAMDPFGAILAAGVSWLMEHVGPLKDALNGLTGNADQIKAQSETWANVAKELGSVASDLNDAINADLQSWSGSASDAYRQRGQDLATSLQAAQKGCEGASSGVKTAGEVVAAVRTLVRDIISELIGHMISWALQVVFTLGIGLAWVVPQVVSAVAKTASQITGLVTKLVKALKALVPLLKKAGTLFEDAGKAFKGLKGGKVAPPPKTKDLSGTPEAPPVKTPGGDGGGTPKGGGYEGTPKDYTPPPGKSGADDSTKSSGYEGTPKDYSPPPGKSGGDDSTSASGYSGDAKDYTPPPASKGGDDSTHASSSGGGGSSGSGGGTPPPVKSDPPPLKADPDPVPAGAGGGGTPKGGTPKSAPPSNKPDNPRDTSVDKDSRVCASDPVDVATGEMILDQIDLVLPLDLELSLERTHVSSYRAGRWFGRSWASTVDQRLEIDDEDVCYFSPDGMVLVYPLPAPGATGLPVEGPRLPLTRRLDGSYVLEEPLRGTSLRFDPVVGEAPGVLPLTAVAGAEQRFDVDYDRTGRPARIRHSDGYEVAFTVTRDRITAMSVVNPASGESVLVTRYGYDPDGRLTQVVNSSGRPMLFDYDTQGRVTGWQDRTGTWYRYVYDAAGRCVKTLGEKGFRDGSFTYDRERLVTVYSDSLGHRTEYHLNEAGQVVREVDAAGHATVSTWDRYDRLLMRTDKLGRTTSYEYDDAGALSRVVRPDGSVVQVALRGGLVAAIAVRDGERTWTRTYDEPIDPFSARLGVAGEFRHEGVGSAAVLPDAVAEAGRTTKGYVPDLFGRPALVDTPGGQVRLDWTVEGLRTARTGPAGGREQWSYDGEGNDVAHVSETGAVTRREYGPFDVVVAEIDEAGGRTTYAYDTELRLLAVTNPLGLTWRYVYDHAGRVTEERDFDGRTLRFEYDAAGQLTRAFNGLGELTELTYDTLGNVVARRAPHGLTTYSHDPVGRLRRAENADAVIEYNRDDRGHVIAQTTNGRTTTFSYAPDGTRVTRRTPSGVDSSWSFGERGAPVGLAGGGHVLAFDRDPAGKETGRSLDGTVVLTQAYDAEQRLTAQEGPSLRRRYDYRADGHLVRTSDSLSGTADFRLDPAGRVVEAIAADRREGFRYDVAGNIVFSGVAGQAAPESGPRAYVGNTLTSAGAISYRHDAQGRVVQRRVGELVWSYGWDGQDRLTGVTTPDGTRWRYRYDPVGRRIAKQRFGPGGEIAEQVEFVWDGGKLVEESHRLADGTTRVRTWDYDPDTDAPVAQHESTGGVRLFHTIVTDPVGRPAELLDAEGRPVWSGRTTVWGRDLPGSGGATATPLRFPGQYLDVETGLHYNVYRYYDPASGRYVSQDPLGLAPAPNPAAYVNNPLRIADPLGLAPTSCKSGGGTGTTSSRAGSTDEPAHVGDIGSTPNPSRSPSPEPGPSHKSGDADTSAEAGPSNSAADGKKHQDAPDFSHNPGPDKTPKYVYHGSGAPPETIFKDGLTSDAIRQGAGPKGPNYDIAGHQHRSYGSGSGYVSTSGDVETGYQFVPQKVGGEITQSTKTGFWGKSDDTMFFKHEGYIYEIETDPGKMVHLPSHPDRVPTMDGQNEWAAVDHIPGSQISGAYKVEGYYNVGAGQPGAHPNIIYPNDHKLVPQLQYEPNPGFVPKPQDPPPPPVPPKD
ncbi:RHS repeat-associated core domain-containing protein [Amycolatopsis sp. NPDC051372]|uniref:RHS repeat-associated core domain-containing protein n=1 Tax=Amycolatopsis sp. NPDC051372 TaxID=3155669 RepID=UPI00342D0DD9